MVRLAMAAATLSAGGTHPWTDGASGPALRDRSRDDRPGVMMTRALMDRIAATPTPLTAYLSKYFIELPLWDEMAGAIPVDPTLVTQSVDAMMDVNITDGVDYSRAHAWKPELAPNKDQGSRPVTIVQAIDTQRFLDGFVAAAQMSPKP